MSRHSTFEFDIQVRTEEELHEMYGIDIQEDGSVYDPCEDKHFDSLAAWADYMERVNDDTASFQKMHGRYDYDE